MENIERTQFVVLTGHLDEQSLPDLIRQLRVQRKSGRLQVEYTDAPGSFFFEDGQIVDAQLGSLRGLEALYAALELRGAAFNFNPLVRPPERSIDRQQQKFISDLVETPRRENLAEIKIAGSAFPASTAALAPAAQPAPLQLAPVHAEMIAPLEERLTAVEHAIHATSRRFSRERLIYAIVIGFLVGLTVVTALQALLNLPKPLAPATDATRANGKLDSSGGANGAAANGDATRAASATDASSKKEGEGVAPTGERTAEASNATKNVASAAALAASSQTQSPPRSSQSSQSSQPSQTTARDARKTVAATAAASTTATAPATRGAYVVRVLMEVKNGQVTDARVLNPRAGAGAYEALALRMARQRRYPENFTGGDTLRIRVKP